MLKTTFTFLFTVLFFQLFSQQNIGYSIDASNKNIDGTYDRILYEAEKQVSLIHSDPTYEIGYYYTLDSKKKEGFLLYSKGKLRFKENIEDSKYQKLKIKEIQSAVIGLDSFFVCNAHTVHFSSNSVRKDPLLMKYMYSYKDNHFSSIIIEGVLKYYVKNKENEYWIKVNGSNSRFQEFALKYFGNVSVIEQKIKSKEYKLKDKETVLYIHKYNSAAEEKTPIYYDKYWNETFSKKKATYKAMVEKANDTLWTFNYYKEDKKLYEASYSSFMPTYKEGKFKCFNKDGSLRRILHYRKDTLKSQDIYNDGKIVKSYRYTYDKKYNQEVFISSIDGKTEINGNYDYNANRTIFHQKYENNQLIESYYKKDDERIYHFCQEPDNFKIDELEAKIKYSFRFNPYEKCLPENTEGIIFVKFIINKKGFAKEFQILNELHPELDSLVNRFCSYIGPEGKTKFDFGTYSVNNENVNYEVTIPFEFMINREYRKPYRYLWLLGNPYKVNMYYLRFDGVMNGMPMITPTPMGF